METTETKAGSDGSETMTGLDWIGPAEPTGSETMGIEIGVDTTPPVIAELPLGRDTVGVEIGMPPPGMNTGALGVEIAGTEAGSDSGTETGIEPGTETGIDAPGVEMGSDVGTEMGTEAGIDSGRGAGIDATGIDMGSDSTGTEAGSDMNGAGVETRALAGTLGTPTGTLGTLTGTLGTLTGTLAATLGVLAGMLAGILAFGSYLLYQQSCSKAVHINALCSNAFCSAKTNRSCSSV